MGRILGAKAEPEHGRIEIRAQAVGTWSSLVSSTGTNNDV